MFDFDFDFKYDSVFELIYTLVWAAYVYVGTSLGGQRMAKKVGMENPWLFWIPGANLYALGHLADIQAARQEGKTTHFRRRILIWLVVPVAITILLCISLVFWLVATVADGIFDENSVLTVLDNMDSASMAGYFWVFLIGFIALLVTYIISLVIYYECLHRIYKLFAPGGATGLLVLSIFVSEAVPAILFALSFKEPVLPAEQNDDWDAPFYTL